jgi:hypothetical protein
MNIFKKEGTFAAALFSNDQLTLDELDEQHLIYKLPIKGIWKPKPLLYQADSFLFVKGGELFLFYELQHWDDPGSIAMVKTKDLKTWTEPLIVLKEPFHLSFPYVFEDHGEIYMIPESQESDSIRLYKGNTDLTQFEYVRTALYQEKKGGIHYNFNDSHIYIKDGCYYLFTSYQKDWMYYQELYIAKDLLDGEFIKHPCSPICTSNEFGRNGGSLIQFGNKLLRVTQDCHQDYGDNISLMEITVLNEKAYHEQLFKQNVFPKNSIFIDGGHQLNITKFKGKYIYATDYKINKWAWYKPYISLLVRLGLHQKKG